MRILLKFRPAVTRSSLYRSMIASSCSGTFLSDHVINSSRSQHDTVYAPKGPPNKSQLVPVHDRQQLRTQQKNH